MQKHLLLPALICFSLTLATGVAADEQQDAAELARVLAEIQKVVPPGWVAEFELVDSRIPSRSGTFPSLVIKSEAKLPVEGLNVMNLPPSTLLERRRLVTTQVRVTIRLVPLPYLSPQDHVQVRRYNAQLIQKRIDFERDQLQNIFGGNKVPGLGPSPPSLFQPKTRHETQLVMQYAFLWAATEPQPLPTHHTEQLAFQMRYQPLTSIRIHDDQRSKEYKQILDAVQKIIVPYETER